MRHDEDDYGFGQVDGDEAPPAWGDSVSFRPTNAGQPWARNVGDPPWKLWGGSVALRVDSQGLDPDHPVLQAQQVAKVAYKRPESWSFWLGGRLLGQNPIPSAAFIEMVFDISTGAGRSQFSTSQPVPVAPTSPFNQLAFGRFVWSLAINDVPQNQPVKYATQVRTPPLDDRDANSFQLVEWIPASDIQVSVKLIVLPILLPTPFVYQAEAHCYFAPRSHVRPDWFQSGVPIEAAFPGDEVGGR